MFDRKKRDIVFFCELMTEEKKVIYVKVGYLGGVMGAWSTLEKAKCAKGGGIIVPVFLDSYEIPAPPSSNDHVWVVQPSEQFGVKVYCDLCHLLYASDVPCCEGERVS